MVRSHGTALRIRVRLLISLSDSFVATRIRRVSIVFVNGAMIAFILFHLLLHELLRVFVLALFLSQYPYRYYS